MAQFNLNPFPVLHTQRLLLRNTLVHDTEAMFAMRSDPKIMERLDKKAATDRKEAEELILRIHEDFKQNKAISWAICLRSNSDALIGHIGFYRMNLEHYRAEIGYTLMPAYWRQGIVHEAIDAVLHFAFETLNLHSVEACINPTNIPSAGVLRKSGFMQEGLFKESYCNAGVFSDTAVFSLLKKDFKPNIYRV